MTSEKSSANEFRLFSRVISYPIVSNLLNNAKTYYDTVAEKHPIVKNACEKTLTSVQTGIHSYILPTVEPVLAHETYKKISDVVVSTVDSYGNQGLDKVEKISSSVVEKRNSLQKRVTELKEKVSPSHLMETVVTPFDSYLDQSIVGPSLGKFLNYAEGLCDSIDEKEQKLRREKGKKLKAHEGPVVRAGKISLRLQQTAISKLKNLSLRAPEKVNAMEYCVDLIAYASNNIDYAMKRSKSLFYQTYDYSKDKLFNLSYKPVSQLAEKLPSFPSTELLNPKNLLPKFEQFATSIRSFTYYNFFSYPKTEIK